MIESVEHTTLVHASASVVYTIWRRFENFPHFMEGVVAMEPLEGRKFLLRVENGGHTFESVCEIILDVPERRLAWRTLVGADSSGVVRFEFQGRDCTRVTLLIKYDPEHGWSDREQVVTRTMQNLERFKELVESGELVPA